MAPLAELSPSRFAARLLELGLRRAWFVCDPEIGEPRASHAALGEIASQIAANRRDFRRHEAVFLEVGPETGVLYGAFIHRSLRGQAQGGLRHWPYSTLAGFLRDGLRLSLGMGRKSALAGLWWGGGKGIIARAAGDAWRDPDYRERLYGEYGHFVSSLQGCFVTAEDAGTTPLDIASVYRRTRFVTCAPEAVGGSGNPSTRTAQGVVRAIEAALAFRTMGDISGKRFAMQGAGQVGSAMIEILFERGAESIVVTELSRSRRAALLDRFADRPLRVECVSASDLAIFADPCDVLIPSALGGVLSPKTIPSIQAPIVCGPANNALEDEVRDARALAARGISCVPDTIANRMGIVACCDEHAGHLSGDPMIARQLDGDAEHSIYGDVRRVLELAARDGTTPTEAANELADKAMNDPHPIHGDRAQRIVASLVASDWADSR